MWKPAKFIDRLQKVIEFHCQYPKIPGPLEKFLRGPLNRGGDTVTARVTSDGMGVGVKYGQGGW